MVHVATGVLSNAKFPWSTVWKAVKCSSVLWGSHHTTASTYQGADKDRGFDTVPYMEPSYW